MPATFRSVEKFCENCGNMLALNCTRDVSRKRFCSRKCNSSFVTKELWKNPDFREKTIHTMNTPDTNQKKGHKKEKHPQWNKKIDLSRKVKQSASLSESILTGKFKPYSNHISGYIAHSKFIDEKIFYRSSYEKKFLEICIVDDSIKSVAPSPWKILYSNSHHYIPDFLIEKDGEKILVEVKPHRRIQESTNQEKFEAARKFCEDMKISFQIFTEKNLTNERKINF